MTTWTDSLDRARPPAAQPPATVAVRLPPRDCLPWARAAMESEAADVSATPEGARNDRLNAAAYSLGQIVAGGYLSESDVTDALLAAAQRCGLPAREATATIASGLRAGAEHPRHPEERPATASQPRPDTTSEPPADDEWTPTDDDAPDAPPSNHDSDDDGYVPTDDDAPDAPRPSEDRARVEHRDAKVLRGPMIELIDGDAIFAPLPPISWVVQGLDIAPGPPVLVAGYGFSAKTITWQSAAVAVCAGLRIWGVFSTRQGRVVHLDYEQGSRLTRERYQRLAMGLDLGARDVAPFLSMACLPAVYLDSPRAEDELCRVFEGATLGIVDSFRAACPSIDENSSEARRPLDMLTRVSERTGVVVVVLHHARKPQRDAPGGIRMAIRGSGALYDASASVLVHEADTASAPVRVTHEKARITGQVADPFVLRVRDIPDGHNPRAGVMVTAEAAPTADEAAAARKRAKIAALTVLVRDLFEREPVQTSPDIMATKLGRAKPDVREVVALMCEAGEVVANGETSDRRYQWVGRE